MRLLVLAALLFRATVTTAAAFDVAFDAPRVRGLFPRGPRVEHATRLFRRPVAPLMLASVDLQDQDGRTALQVAAGLGHPSVAKQLIAAGADVNKPTKEGMTALMLAASVGNTDMVEMLLDAGADMELQDEDGTTALMAASFNGFADVVETLLRSDVDTLSAQVSEVANLEKSRLVAFQPVAADAPTPAISSSTKSTASATPASVPAGPAVQSRQGLLGQIQEQWSSAAGSESSGSLSQDDQVRLSTFHIVNMSSMYPLPPSAIPPRPNLTATFAATTATRIAPRVCEATRGSAGSNQMPKSTCPLASVTI